MTRGPPAPRGHSPECLLLGFVQRKSPRGAVSVQRAGCNEPGGAANAVASQSRAVCSSGPCCQAKGGQTATSVLRAIQRASGHLRRTKGPILTNFPARMQRCQRGMRCSLLCRGNLSGNVSNFGAASIAKILDRIGLCHLGEKVETYRGSWPQALLPSPPRP